MKLWPYVLHQNLVHRGRGGGILENLRWKINLRDIIITRCFEEARLYILGWFSPNTTSVHFHYKIPQRSH